MLGAMTNSDMERGSRAPSLKARQCNRGPPADEARLACGPEIRCNRVMSDDATHRIEVTAHAMFVPEQSDIVADRYVFAYTVTIRNSGSVPAQLVSRHWIITDALKRVQEVRGQGVVGEQPWLAPGQHFEYSSSASIATPVGTMHGTYQMVAADGTRFDADIPPFQLCLPRTLH